MGIFDFFNSVAENFRNHYITLTNSAALQRETGYRIAPDEVDDDAVTAETDTFEPSSSLTTEPAATEVSDPDSAEATEPNTVAENEVVPEETQAPAESDATEQPYRFRHLTNFNYEVRLEFQLRAIAALAQEIADGETVTTQELAAAGFGLTAAMDFSGTRLQEARGSDILQAEKRNGTDLVRGRGASAFAVQDRNFALESFSRESLKIKRTLNANSSEHYQRAVNKFSLRFRLDNQFSFAYLTQFNAQTQRIAETEPQTVEHYADTAGEVADKGSVDMMATFFEAVEAYLDQAEEYLLSRAGEFFDLAAEELGLSDQALPSREHLINSIETFFDQVDDAVALLESRFLAPADVPDALPPQTGVVELYAPAVNDEPQQVAFA